MRVGTRFLLITVAIFLISTAAMVLWVSHQMRQQALKEAESKARILLERNLATHTYFTHQLKPAVFKAVEGILTKDDFEPAWMSSTYAVRSIDQYFKSLSLDDYYYKECAIDARDPHNEADAYEKEFIEKINADPMLNLQTAIRDIAGQSYYVVLRRGEVMEETCLLCHSVPQAAPQGMVLRYGPDRSFHREVGEVVSAISIRVPLGAAYAQARSLTWKLVAGMVAGLLLLVAAVIGSNRILFSNPLNAVREKTELIARQQTHLGEQISARLPGEWGDLVRDFNEMSARLRFSHDNLEERVAERTAELTGANERLTKEIAERKKAEEVREILIGHLEDALGEVKTLQGIIPICSGCKKIRDDEGYWQQVETYIQKHSGAQFSHGICPVCAEELYSEVYKVR
ncbi:MAG: DUF3365 domain-containing protein [Deltaproteobacteria bacterium]|nr:DUF3365 domain-containing protein [Deltaproteobacteria bacterium]